METILFISLYEDISSIGIRYLSSSLKSRGKRVHTIHMPLVEDCIEYAGERDSEEEIRILLNLIGILKPDAVGVGVMTSYFRRAARLASAIRKRHPHVTIIFGGIHATLRPGECLEHADIACVGEAEETMLELSRLSRFTQEELAGVKGVAYKTEGGVQCNEPRPLVEDLGRYPFPDYSVDSDFVILNDRLACLDGPLLKKMMPKYLFGKRSYRILTTRGCPFSCSYCCNHALKKKMRGKHIRTRSVQNVIREMKAARDALSVEGFRIMDDSFLFSPLPWFEEFNEEYKRHIRLPFSCLSHPKNIVRSKMQLLVDCGLTHVQLGLQTGSERINFDVYNRKVTNREFLEAIDVIKSLDPRPLASIDVILDNPLETEQDKIETIRMLQNITVPYYLCCQSLTCYPETGILALAEREGFIDRSAGRKAYEASFLDIDQDYLNGLIILTSIKGVPPKLIDWLLAHEKAGRACGALISALYRRVLVRLTPFIRKVILKFL